jgi:dihydropteroate synthase
MKEKDPRINTSLLTTAKLEYQVAYKEYLEAKKEMDDKVPTGESLKRMIIATANLSEARKRLEDEKPTA